ncbi:MAG: beta-lactamase family protein [Lewinellaceae bacterium]|nr:beta-lactamase family protein [Lewinellaceae bacterium]
MKTSFVLIALLWGLLLSPYSSQRCTGVRGEGPAAPAAGFAALTGHFHRLVDSGALAGTVMLVARGDRAFTDAYGMQDIELERPMQMNTIFRIASMTKPIVSVAVMMLVEEGKLSLDDPLEKYLPAFSALQVYDPEKGRIPLRRSVTVRDLMMHTSGFSAGDFDKTPVGALYREAFETEPTSLESLVNTLGTLPLAHQPGEGWTYGHSTDVLARVAEIASGTPIRQLLRQRLFEPLGMVDTDFGVPADKASRFASLYGAGLALRQSAAESPYVKGEIFPRGNGGLVSTAHDYGRFAKMLAAGGIFDGRRYLRAETLNLMMRNHLPESMIPLRVGPISTPGQGFGLGFGVLVEDTEYGGRKGDCFWPGAAFTYFFVQPESGTVGIFLCQNTDLSKLHYLYEFHGLAGEAFDQN